MSGEPVTKHISRSLELDAKLSESRQKCQKSNLWQRRFWEYLIRDEQDFIEHCDYIHYNPVKHGLCHTPQEWPFSSFHRFVARGIYSLDWCDDKMPEIVGEVWD